jgi:hypothetical protein
MSIRDIRNKALGASEIKLCLSNKDTDIIQSKTDSAISKIKHLVKTNPNQKHHVDIYIGNSTFNSDLVDLYVEQYNKALKQSGYAGELVAERSGWNNVGDPYYMGEPEDITGYEVRIKER